VNLAAVHLNALGLITQITPHYKYKLIPWSLWFLELINESQEKHIVFAHALIGVQITCWRA